MKKEIAKKIVSGQKPEDFTKEWAILLNYSDHQDLTQIWKAETTRRETFSPQAVFEAYKHYSYIPQVRETSCGDSGALFNPLNPFIGDPRAVRTMKFGLPLMQNEQQDDFKFGLGKKDEKEDYMNDKNLCRCGGKSAHFHCPGEVETKVDGKIKMEECKHPIIVGRGIKRCSNCGEGKVCYSF